MTTYIVSSHRHVTMWHRLPPWFNRYCVLMDATSVASALTAENTIDIDEEGGDPYTPAEPDHRNYDLQMERTPAGTQFPSTAHGVAGARRRQDSRLGVSRPPLLEPAGSGREGFYQQRSLMVLAWWCPGPAQPIDVGMV